MKPQLKNLIFGVVTVVFFFICLELALRPFVLPCSYDFIERAIIQQGLKPEKRPGEFRAFFFGESTMHGGHLYPKSKIDIWVELYLEDLLGKDAASRFVHINFGRLGAHSRFISQAFFDTLVYKPDVVVFYSAHNDFCILENREELLERKTFWFPVKQFFQEDVFKKSRFVSLIKRLGVARKVRRHLARLEKERAEDHWYDERVRKQFGDDVPLLDPKSPEFQAIEQSWQANIEKVITVAQANKVPVVFLMGVSRWEGFPPFKSVYNPKLTQDEKDLFQGLFDRGEEFLKNGDYESARGYFERSIKIDSQYALAYYHLAQCYEKLGDAEMAKKYYRVSNDWDYFPVRAPSVVNEFYAELRDKKLPGVYVVDTQELFDRYSSNNIAGADLIVDQLHPTAEGQALIAEAIVKLMDREKLFPAGQAWPWEKLSSFAELSKALGFDEDFVHDSLISGAEYVGSYYSEAIQLLEQAVELRPQSIRARSMLAWVYWKNNQREKAKDLYLELNKDVSQEAADFFMRNPDIKGYVFAYRDGSGS